MNKLILFIILFLIGCGQHNSSQNTPVAGTENSRLKIGAFNIQIFGVSKMSNPSVASDLVKIISKYDLILIQEIRDPSDQAILDLLNQVNISNNNEYLMALGSRVGRSSSKEQYAYFYKKTKLIKMDQREYIDYNIFERGPLVVKFKDINSQKEFITVGIHTKPTDAENEINHLDDVFEHFSSIWNLSNGIILGDFNQDCSYLSDSKFFNLDLTIKTLYTYHISKFDDTTIGDSNCAYDQIVTTNNISSSVKSSKIYRFEDLNLLSHLNDISDHYPVEIEVEL